MNNAKLAIILCFGLFNFYYFPIILSFLLLILIAPLFYKEMEFLFDFFNILLKKNAYLNCENGFFRVYLSDKKNLHLIYFIAKNKKKIISSVNNLNIYSGIDNFLELISIFIKNKKENSTLNFYFGNGPYSHNFSILSISEIEISSRTTSFYDYNQNCRTYSHIPAIQKQKLFEII